MKKFLPSLLILFSAAWIVSCQGEEEHMAAAISDQDSLPFMHAIGVSTLISDSGIIRYHLVAEEWDIYNYPDKEPTWKFMKGLLMQRYNEKFHIDLYVQSDTAYLHNQETWELRGRVRVRNVAGTVFLTEELFWNMNRHEMWNHQYMHIITPERELEGTEFRSNEQMTRYSVSNSVGDFPLEEKEEEPAMPSPTDSTQSQQQATNTVVPSAPGKYDNIRKK